MKALQAEAVDLRELRPEDGSELAALLGAQRAEYMRYFHPFAFAAEAIASMLAAARRDRYWGIWWEGELAGMAMLRGWDAGYERPAFGVFVAEKFCAKGMAAAALRFCLAWCMEHAIPSLMLTVHPENVRARTIYLSAGFRPTGTFSGTGDEILAKETGQAAEGVPED